MATQRCGFCGRDAHYEVKGCPLCVGCAENALHGVIRVFSSEEIAQRKAKSQRERRTFTRLVKSDPALTQLFRELQS